MDGCDTATSFARFDHGHLAHEEAKLKSGDELVWENEYDAEGRLAMSRLSANSRFAIESVETVYTTRDGSPVDEGKYERFAKHDVW